MKKYFLLFASYFFICSLFSQTNNNEMILMQGDKIQVSKIIKDQSFLATRYQHNKKTALMIAILYNKNIDVIKYLLDNGASVSETDQDGNTPLMHAASCRDKSIIQLLIDAGANINEKNRFGRTPLMYAAISNNLNTIEYMVKLGASVNDKTINNENLLYCAARNTADVMEYFIKAGNDINNRTNEGKTTLMLVAESANASEAISMLLKHGAQVNERYQDRDGITLLMSQIYMGSIESVDILLKAGAQLNDRDNNGRNAIIHAALAFSKEKIKFLLQQGANINDQDNLGFTPLMHVIKSGRINNYDNEIINYIIKNGASVKIKSYEEKYACEYASDTLRKTPSLGLLEYLSYGSDYSKSFNIDKASDKEIESFLTSSVWVNNVWKTDLWQNRIEFNTDKTGNAPYCNEDFQFKYAIKDQIITLYNTVSDFPQKFKIEKDNSSIYGLFKLVSIEDASLCYYPLKYKFLLHGNRFYNGILVNMGDIPQNINKKAAFYVNPESKNLFIFPAFNYSNTSTPVYSIEHFYAFKKQGECAIEYLGSANINNQKYYLGMFSLDDGDKAGFNEYFLWSINTSKEYPALIYDYYSALNKKDYKTAYSLWHKKSSISVFIDIYSDLQEIGILHIEPIENMGKFDWKLFIKYNNEKIYKVLISSSETSIINSSSELYNGIIPQKNYEEMLKIKNYHN